MRQAISRGVGATAFLFFFTGCASSSYKIPDAESAGAKLFIERCSGCHATPHPKRHSADEWPHYVVLMEKRMVQRDKPPLSDSERKLIMEYLVQHAR